MQHAKFEQHHLEHLQSNRTLMPEYLDRMYKLDSISSEKFAKIVMLCEAYEVNVGLAALFPYWSSNPEYLYQLNWLVYDGSRGIGMSVKRTKKYIRQQKALNSFIEYARKHLKMSYAETLRYLKIV